MTNLLSTQDFHHLIRWAPLVSIDIIAENPAGEWLLGLRTNAPAQNNWFVPGGRIRKNETINLAAQRVTFAELGRALCISQAEFLGVFEHFYQNSVVDESVSTHYVVLAYRWMVRDEPFALPLSQHSAYRWLSPSKIISDDTVHPFTQQYASRVLPY